VLSFRLIYTLLSNILNIPLISTNPSDLVRHQPLTLATLFSLLLGYYAQAVLAILPNTFIFKAFVAPFHFWASLEVHCEIRPCCVLGTVTQLGHHDELGYLNMIFVVRTLFLEAGVTVYR
jgi:hypothetical protein